MSQHDYVIDNASGATVRADINSALSAIQSLNSGTSAPSSTAAGMLWLDTTGGAPYALKIRDAGNNHWLTLASVTDPGSDGNIETSATIKGTIDSSANLSNATFPGRFIEMFDKYYIENNFGSNGTITPWTRVTASTHSGYAPLGTGLTHSSGIFSFPETGLYHIQAQINFEEGTGGDDNIECRLKVTTDNSTYKTVLSSMDSVTASVVTGAVALGPTLINCTSTTNVKFLFESLSVESGNQIRGSDGQTDGGQDVIFTSFGVMKIGASI